MIILQILFTLSFIAGSIWALYKIAKGIFHLVKAIIILSAQISYNHWPIITGVVSGIFLCIYKYDNIGVIFILISIGVEYFWNKKFHKKFPSIFGECGSGGGYDDYSWHDDKRATYDTDGKVTGYVDK